MRTSSTQGEVVEGQPLNPESMGFLAPKQKLKAWFPENPIFWSNEGKEIAYRNLLVSVPNLLLGFAIWVMWSGIVTNIQKQHDKDPSVYPFKEMGEMTAKQYRELLSIIPAIAGLSGGTFRIPNSFSKFLTVYQC